MPIAGQWSYEKGLFSLSLHCLACRKEVTHQGVAHGWRDPWRYLVFAEGQEIKRTPCPHLWRLLGPPPREVRPLYRLELLALF